MQSSSAREDGTDFANRHSLVPQSALNATTEAPFWLVMRDADFLHACLVPFLTIRDLQSLELSDDAQRQALCRGAHAGPSWIEAGLRDVRQRNIEVEGRLLEGLPFRAMRRAIYILLGATGPRHTQSTPRIASMEELDPLLDAIATARQKSRQHLERGGRHASIIVGEFRWLPGDIQDMIDSRSDPFLSKELFFSLDVHFDWPEPAVLMAAALGWSQSDRRGIQIVSEHGPLIYHVDLNADVVCVDPRVPFFSLDNLHVEVGSKHCLLESKCCDIVANPEARAVFMSRQGVRCVLLISDRDEPELLPAFAGQASNSSGDMMYEIHGAVMRLAPLQMITESNESIPLFPEWQDFAVAASQSDDDVSQSDSAEEEQDLDHVDHPMVATVGAYHEVDLPPVLPMLPPSFDSNPP